MKELFEKIPEFPQLCGQKSEGPCEKVQNPGKKREKGGKQAEKCGAEQKKIQEGAQQSAEKEVEPHLSAARPHEEIQQEGKAEQADQRIAEQDEKNRFQPGPQNLHGVVEQAEQKPRRQGEQSQDELGQNRLRQGLLKEPGPEAAAACRGFLIAQIGH